MTADRRECCSGSSQVIVTSGIVAKAIGRRGHTATVCILGGIACEHIYRMDTLEYIAIGGGIFRLPGIGLCLTYRGIAVISKTRRGV